MGGPAGLSGLPGCLLRSRGVLELPPAFHRAPAVRGGRADQDYGGGHSGTSGAGLLPGTALQAGPLSSRHPSL